MVVWPHFWGIHIRLKYTHTELKYLKGYFDVITFHLVVKKVSLLRILNLLKFHMVVYFVK